MIASTIKETIFFSTFFSMRFCKFWLSSEIIHWEDLSFLFNASMGTLCGNLIIQNCVILYKKTLSYIKQTNLVENVPTSSQFRADYNFFATPETCIQSVAHGSLPRNVIILITQPQAQPLRTNLQWRAQDRPKAQSICVILIRIIHNRWSHPVVCSAPGPGSLS